jgi:hypothetical protein
MRRLMIGKQKAGAFSPGLWFLGMIYFFLGASNLVLHRGHDLGLSVRDSH